MVVVYGQERVQTQSCVVVVVCVCEEILVHTSWLGVLPRDVDATREVIHRLSVWVMQTLGHTCDQTNRHSTRLPLMAVSLRESAACRFQSEGAPTLEPTFCLTLIILQTSSSKSQRNYMVHATALSYASCIPLLLC